MHFRFAEFLFIGDIFGQLFRYYPENCSHCPQEAHGLGQEMQAQNWGRGCVATIQAWIKTQAGFESVCCGLAQVLGQNHKPGKVLISWGRPSPALLDAEALWDRPLSCQIGALYSDSFTLWWVSASVFKVLSLSLTPEPILTNSQQGAYVFDHCLVHMSLVRLL